MSVLFFVVLLVWLVALTRLVLELRRRPVSREVRVIGQHARLVKRIPPTAPHRNRRPRRTSWRDAA